MEHSRLQHFPVAFFSSVMGLCGFTMALQHGEALLGLPRSSGYVAAMLSLLGLFLPARGPDHRHVLHVPLDRRGRI